MYNITPTKTKLTSLALATFIALTLHTTIVWEFAQAASESSQVSTFTLSPDDASSFEI